MWLGNAKYWFSCRKMYIFDSASGDRPKPVGLMVRRPGEGLLLIGNSDLLTTCGAAHAGPFSPTRLAPHSWRADPWSYILAPPPLACQASKPALAQGLLLGLPRNYDCSRQATSRAAEELQLSDIWTSWRWMLFSHTWPKEQG